MAGTEHRTLDHDALKAAIKAVEEIGSGSADIYNYAEELAETAINVYMADIVRQLDLRPCEDCEDEDDDASSTQTTRA